MTLGVLVLLSVIAMNFSFSTRLGSASTRNFKDETKAYYLAMSGYHEALGILRSDKDTKVDFLDEEGNLYLDSETMIGHTKQVTDEAELEIKITDEGSKININSAANDRLERLFNYIGMPADEQLEVIDCILDWKDSGDNDAHRLNGAEKDYYEDLTPPYTAKNSNFDIIEELMLVKGFKSEYLYGSEKNKSMYDLITTFGDSIININTASREVMEIIGINEIDIDTIFAQRTKEFGGVKNIPIGIPSVRTASYNFRVEVTAKMKESNQIVKIVSVVKRVPSLKDFDIKTVYWRESIESSRS